MRLIIYGLFINTGCFYMRLFCFFKPLAASNAIMGVFLPLNKAKKTIRKDGNVNTRIEGENKKGSESRVSPAVRSLARTGLHLLGGILRRCWPQAILPKP